MPYILHISRKTLLFLSNLSQTIFSILKVVINILLFNHYDGPDKCDEKLMIIGNGPSLKDNLKKYDLKKSGANLFCVNNFATSEFYEKLKPDNYLLFDPIFWEDGIVGSFEKQRTELYCCLNNKTDWNLKLYLPYQSKKFYDKYKFIKNKNINVKFFNQTTLSGFDFLIHRLYQHNLGMVHAQNVLVAVIFLAINSGCKNIYLIGADHSWHEDLWVDSNNVVCAKLNRFYDKNGPEARPLYKGGKDEGTFKMDEILFALGKMFKGYQILNEYSNFRNVKIYNASTKTYIDAFERIDLTRVING